MIGGYPIINQKNVSQVSNVGYRQFQARLVAYILDQKHGMPTLLSPIHQGCYKPVEVDLETMAEIMGKEFGTGVLYTDTKITYLGFTLAYKVNDQWYAWVEREDMWTPDQIKDSMGMACALLTMSMDLDIKYVEPEMPLKIAA
jgi:hypothetical protein